MRRCTIFTLTFLLWAVSAPAGSEIYKITFQDQYFFSPDRGTLLIVGRPNLYHLVDGSTFRSGAGFAHTPAGKLTTVERRGSNLVYHFEFREGDVFSHQNMETDIAAGTLKVLGPLELVTTPGSSNATLATSAEITGNPVFEQIPATSRPHPYALPAGSTASVELAASPESGTWEEDTFKKEFTVLLQGSITFRLPGDLDSMAEAGQGCPPRDVRWRGRALYAGREPGPVCLEPLSTNVSVTPAAVAANEPFEVSVTAVRGVEGIRAYIDENGSGTCDVWEAQSERIGCRLFATGETVFAETTLSDPDQDQDDLPDWWETGLLSRFRDRFTQKSEHIMPQDDTDKDGVSNADEYRLGTDGGDPDSVPPRVSFVRTEHSFVEGEAGAGVRLSLVPPRQGVVTAVVCVAAAGTAEDGTDYRIPDGRVVFTTGETRKILAIEPAPDDTREADETVLLEIAEVQGRAVMGRDNHMTVIIKDRFEDVDNDGLPDAWERSFFGDLSARADEDPDHDGWDNNREYLRGGNPDRKWQADAKNTLRLELGLPGLGPGGGR